MAIIKRQSVSNQIIEYFLQQIESGKLKPGDRIPCERDFAESLGVSRVPLREAICALSAFGILSSRQGEGTFVNRFNAGMVGRIMYVYTLLDEASFNEVMEVRSFLESHAARMASQRRTDEQLDKLRAAKEEFETKLNLLKLGRAQVEDVFQADSMFHNVIGEASRNKVFAEFLGAVRNPITHTLLDDSHRQEAVLQCLERSCEYHEKVYNAIAQQKEEDAYNVMLEHVEDVSNAVEML